MVFAPFVYLKYLRQIGDKVKNKKKRDLTYLKKFTVTITKVEKCLRLPSQCPVYEVSMRHLASASYPWDTCIARVNCCP